MTTANFNLTDIELPFTTIEGKKWLKDHLHMGPVRVTFIKKDGTERTMECTLDERVIPPTEKKTDRVKTVNEDTCPVYDIEKKEWRSFRYDSIKVIEFDV